MEETKFEKILIIGHSNIGDVCYDLVVVNPLRRQFPGAKIYFLTSPAANDIVEGYKGIDKVIIFDKRGKDKGIRGRLCFAASLRKEHFNRVIVLKDTWLYKYLGIPLRFSVRRYLGCLPEKKKMHIADIYLEFLRSLGVNAQEAVWDFAVGGEGYFSDKFLAGDGISSQDEIIGILPFSSWSLKDWPVESWNELAEGLSRQYQFKIIAFGKVNDDFNGREKIKRLSPLIVSALNKTTLKQALALIKRCRFFIGVDSSLLHLARCMKVESVGLYGATSKEYIYPYFHYQNIVASSAKLPCMPCYPGLNPCSCMQSRLSISPCMQGIAVKDVLERVKQKMEGNFQESRA